MPTVNREARRKWATLVTELVSMIIAFEFWTDRLRAMTGFMGNNMTIRCMMTGDVGKWMSNLVKRQETHMQSIAKPPEKACDHTRATGESACKAYCAGKHGWYNRCSLCQARWKWNSNVNEWQLHPDTSRASSSRPPPLSFATAEVPPQESATPSTSSQTLGATAKPKAKSGQRRRPEAEEEPEYNMAMDSELSDTSEEDL